MRTIKAMNTIRRYAFVFYCSVFAASAISLVLLFSSPAAADDGPDCEYILAYLSDGSQSFKELCGNEDADKRERGDTLNQRKKNYLASLRINWSVDHVCSSLVQETDRTGCYVSYDPDNSNDASDIDDLKTLSAVEEPEGTLTEYDQWRRDRLTTKSITLVLVPIIDCSLSKDDFRKRYGDLGGAVNEQRGCDPNKPRNPQVAHAKGYRGSPGTGADIGAVRMPNESKNDVPKTGGQNERSGAIERQPEPSDAPSPQPDPGPAAPSEPPPSTPPSTPQGGTSGGTTQGSTQSTEPESDNRTEEQKFNDGFDSDGDGCFSNAERGKAAGALGNDWSVNQNDAMQDLNSRRC